MYKRIKFYENKRMSQVYNSSAELIEKCDLANFLQLLKANDYLKVTLVQKLIVLLANANLQTSGIALAENDFPVVTYLAHPSDIQIECREDIIKPWLNLEEFYLNLRPYNLGEIEGHFNNNQLRLKTRNSSLNWEDLKMAKSALEIFFIPEDIAVITGKISSKTAAGIAKLDITKFNDRLIYLTPTSKFSDFKRQCTQEQLRNNSTIEDNRLSPLHHTYIKKNITPKDLNQR